MDPISPREEEGDDADNIRSSSSKFSKFTDEDLDKLQFGLNELEKVMSAFPGGDPTNFIDSFLANHSHINNPNNHALPPPPPQTQRHFTTTEILDDFDDFETKMLPPTPSSSLCSLQRENATAANHLRNSTGITPPPPPPREDRNLAREIEESQVMIEEMADDHHQVSSCTFVLENSNDSTENVNVDIAFDDDYFCVGDIAGGSGISPFSEQAYGCSPGLVGDYFQGVPSMTFFRGPSPSVRYFICSQNSNGSGSEKVNTRGKKRRCKGVVETEEDAARRVERTKIKNREAAAKAHQRKQAHEAHLQTLLLKLRKKNGFLKNMVMFLQGHERADIHPQPLRRTISGPI